MDEKIGIPDQLEQSFPHVGPDYVKNLEGETKEVRNVGFGHVREPLLSSSSGASLRCPATIQYSAMEQAVDPLVPRHSYRILLELRQRVSGGGESPRSSPNDLVQVRWITHDLDLGHATLSRHLQNWYHGSQGLGHLLNVHCVSSRGVVSMPL